MASNTATRKSMNGLVNTPTDSENINITQNLDMNSFQIVDLGTGVNATDAVNLGQIAGIASNTAQIAIIDNSITLLDASLVNLNFDASFEAVDASLVFLDSSAIQFSLAINTIEVSLNNIQFDASFEAVDASIVFLDSSAVQFSSAIATNTTNIATNATNIASNTSAISTNTTNIATNTTNIATNTTNIASNATNIATNTTNIATNTTNIASNTSAIATNTSAISDMFKDDGSSTGSNSFLWGSNADGRLKVYSSDYAFESTDIDCAYLTTESYVLGGQQAGLLLGKNGEVCLNGDYYEPFCLNYGGYDRFSLDQTGVNIHRDLACDRDVKLLAGRELNLSTGYLRAESTGGDIRMKATGGTVGFTMKSTGVVGIGTTNPTKAKLEISGYVNISLGARYYNSSGNNGYTTTNRNISVYCSNDLACRELQVFSDLRIKENIIDISLNYSLEKLRGIKCVNFNYKDRLSRGDGQVIGFIAQQVKEVFPEAINETHDFIPNEMRPLNNISWKGLEDISGYNLTTDLTDVSGVAYSFFVCDKTTAEDEQEVRVIGNSDNTFTFDKKWESVYCYGKEVKDFLLVEQSKLLALNISATQDLDKQIIELKDRILKLENK